VASCAGAVLTGYLSDVLGARRRLMIGAGLLTAVALVLLAQVSTWPMLVAAYALFHLALAAFFAVESAFVAEMMTGLARRGRLLGVMNLANTVPTILTAALALRATKAIAFEATMPTVLLGCAGACGLAAALCALMAPPDQRFNLRAAGHHLRALWR
jgi:MFS family permease